MDIRRVILTACASGAIASAVVASETLLIARQRAPTASVFTAQQAAAGKVAFAKTCAACHMPDLSGNNEVPPLAGTIFMNTWRTRSTKDLFDYVSGAMPPGGPSQSLETYASIVAYILQSNGAVGGPQEFGVSSIAPIVSVILAPSTPQGVSP